MREIGEKGIASVLLINARPDMAVEVTIGAFAHAEWPVDVKRERIVGAV